MIQAPQKVTSRYARNLLVKGKNNEYVLEYITRRYSMVDEITVGDYFLAEITQLNVRREAAGATPEQAVNRCLEKHGVTFR
jgi:hypothetical protein